MYTAAEARRSTPSQADIKFKKDLDSNFRIIRAQATTGGHEAVLYDGYDRPRMKQALSDVGYTVVDVPNGCLRARW